MSWTMGLRQFLADFMVAGYQLVRTSLTRRPDAVSFDYLWSAAPGPVANGDPSAGLAARAWYARADDAGNVYLARANAGNTAWEAESLLFAYTGAPILEMGLAFEQQGRPVIAAERATGSGGAPEVWLYWFNPSAGGGLGAFVLDNFGPGRTPRTIFDEIENPQDGDVQFIYLRDGVGLVRREQRDAFAVQYGSSLTDTTNRYIEEALMARGARIRVEGSLRDPVLGTYTRWVLESHPYPLYLSDEATAAIAFVEADLLTIAIDSNLGSEDMTAGIAFASGVLLLVVIEHSLYDIEDMTAAIAFGSGLLETVVIEHSLYDIEEMTAAIAFGSGLLETVVIEHSLYDADEATASISFQSAVLEVP